MLWQGEYPKCLACGWWDHGMPLRIVTVGIQVPLAGFDEVEAALIHDGIRERLDRRGGLEADMKALREKEKMQ